MTGDGAEPPPVGSLAEEAARLLGALQDLAATAGHGHANAAGSVVGGMAAGLRDVEQHLATGAPECRYCPVCRVVSVVRGTSPEVREHLATAGSALLSAATALLATPVPDGHGPAAPRVQRIDLDDAGDDPGGRPVDRREDRRQDQDEDQDEDQGEDQGEEQTGKEER